MEWDKPLLKKRARRYSTKEGFVEGNLTLTRNHLLFEADSKEHTQKIPLRQITDLTIQTNPEVREKGYRYGILDYLIGGGPWLLTTSGTKKVYGTLIRIKARNNQNQETITWLRLYEDPQPTYNTIHETLKRYNKKGNGAPPGI